MISPSIFVSDEQPVFVELIKDILIDAGYPNTVSHLGDNAFQHIREERPALILLDISVSNPGHGWSILDVLRLHRETRAIPVIILSTEMQLIEEKAELLRSLNCQSLEKPFEVEALLDKVAAAIGPPPATRL
jgi:CheY-like chemotaxis protein